MQSVLFFISLFVLLASYYFQYFVGLEPCALCIMQRIMVIGLTVLFFIGILKKNVSVFLTFLQILLAAFGMFFAGRQLWLQSSAVVHSACLPKLSVLIHYMPWQQVVKFVFLGTGDCAEVSWQWLGITMPGWVFLYFLLVFLLTILLLLTARKN